MYGAIIGDIAGALYELEEMRAKKAKQRISYEERIKRLDPKVPLLPVDSTYTDDTCNTVAIADCILHQGNYRTYLQAYGRREKAKGKDKRGINPFGAYYMKWLDEKKEVGTSFGNGSAMRISPVGWYFDTYQEVKRETIKATKPSHNTEEGIKGALAISTSVYWLRQKVSKEDLKDFLEKTYDYHFDFDFEDLQRNYEFYATCQKSVPQAIFCFLSSTGFEDAIRKALSIGGDTDTIAAMTGSLAEAYYGVPEELKQLALTYLPEEYIKVVEAFEEKIKERQKRYVR